MEWLGARVVNRPANLQIDVDGGDGRPRAHIPRVKHYARPSHRWKSGVPPVDATGTLVLPGGHPGGCNACPPHLLEAEAANAPLQARDRQR